MSSWVAWLSRVASAPEFGSSTWLYTPGCIGADDDKSIARPELVESTPGTIRRWRQDREVNAFEVVDSECLTGALGHMTARRWTGTCVHTGVWGRTGRHGVGVAL